MKIGNIKFDKKKLGALILSAGLIVGGVSIAIGSNNKKNEQVVYPTKPSWTIYYTSGNQSFVSNGEQIGYISNENLDIPSELEHNYTVCYQEVYIKDDNIGIFLYPSFDSEYRCILNKGEKVTLNAYGDDGWAVVNYTYNGEVGIGFVHQAFLQKNDPYLPEVTATPVPTYTPVPTNTPEPVVTANPNLITVAKITGNNVNVRSSARSDKDNIIGFCDITDKFTILGEENGFYIIDYLGQRGYVSSKYVTEVEIDKSDLEISKMVYLPNGGNFYDDNDTVLCYLPAYQNVLVLDEVGSYYKVSVDGVIGYVKKKDTKALTRRCVVVDTSRQILKVYKNGKEVFRCRVITGAKGRETELGCHVIGHRMEGYTFENSGIYNEYWLQFDGNRGIHPADANGGAGWQKESYFKKATNDAYDAWASGRGKTYPAAHGSHGCVNTMINDTRIIYDLVREGDNVLVIEQNDLIRNRLISFVLNQDWSYCATNNIDNNYQKTIKLV